MAGQAASPDRQIGIFPAEPADTCPMRWSLHSKLDSFLSRAPQPLRAGHVGRLLLVLLGLVVGGCVEEQVVYNSWSLLEEMADEPALTESDTSRQRQRRQRAKQWAVLIASIDGSGHRQAAADLVARLRRESRLTDVWARELEQQTLVFKGGYRDPTGRTALNAQRQVRMIKIDNARPFASAQLVPVVGGGNIAANPFDLRQFAGHYSLQVEVYDDGVEGHRDVAEQRTQSLREQGDNAFYYHGPHRSMVTIGLFTHDEAFVLKGNIDAYTPAIHDLQKRHPRNLHNGHTVIEKENGRQVREQPSFLVHIR